MMRRVAESLATTDQIRVSLDCYRHGTSDAAVIICPGFCQSKETATFRRLSRAMARGRDVICMDFRGHGRSSGLYTFSARESADLDVVLHWAAARYQRIGVMGFSMGGAIAINTISRHQSLVRSLVAVSAPAVFEDIEFKFWTPEAIRTGIQGTEPGAGCRPGSPLLEKVRPLDTIQALGELPRLFVHGTRDVIVGVGHSHRLFEAAGQPKRLEIIEGGSHAEALFRDEPGRLLHLVEGWWAQTLDGAPADQRGAGSAG